MPLSKYNRAFGGAKGSASKAHAAMVKEYGTKKGEQVFYATKNKRTGGGNFDPAGSTIDPHRALASEHQDENHS